MTSQADERTRLLNNQDHQRGYNDDDTEAEVVEFGEDDEENPRNWPQKIKYLQVVIVFIIAVNGPLASSMFAPAFAQMADAYGEDKQILILGQTGFVCMLAIAPLFLAPMSETFGRRIIFVMTVAGFTLLQIPIALAPNAATFVVLRVFAGACGSVGVANGGGSLSDLFVPAERAKVFGVYMLGPLLGPSFGPFIGGLAIAYLDFRWISWIMCMISCVATLATYFFLYETNTVTLLQERKKAYEKENPKKKYHVKGGSDESVLTKIKNNSTRATKILFSQPIVLTMSAYQALVFSTMYSLYISYNEIWSGPPYNFDTVHVALTYLGPAVGFIITACIMVPYTNTIYDYFAAWNNDEDGRPEYRLPFGYVGATLLPVSLFWFAWTAENGVAWPIPVAATLAFGASQVSIFNAVNNYFIDAFESQAASALAAGAFLRSITGGVVPLFIPQLLQEIGYGWTISIFAFVATALMPAPLLFYKFGSILREKFAMKD